MLVPITLDFGFSTCLPTVCTLDDFNLVLFFAPRRTRRLGDLFKDLVEDVVAEIPDLDLETTEDVSYILRFVKTMCTISDTFDSQTVKWVQQSPTFRANGPYGRSSSFFVSPPRSCMRLAEKSNNTLSTIGDIFIHTEYERNNLLARTTALHARNAHST